MLETHRNLLDFIKNHDLRKERIQYGSVLGMFGGLYTSHYFLDSRLVRGKIAQLQRHIDHFPQEEQEKLLLIFGDILARSEAQAFEEGMRMGICLVEELREVTSD